MESPGLASVWQKKSQCAKFQCVAEKVTTYKIPIVLSISLTEKVTIFKIPILLSISFTEKSYNFQNSNVISINLTDQLTTYKILMLFSFSFTENVAMNNIPMTKFEASTFSLPDFDGDKAN